MRPHTHTEDRTGLDALDPQKNPARDTTYFREIRTARARAEKADTQLRDAVANARAAGDSWTIIGAALGTTRQAAYQRFGRT